MRARALLALFVAACGGAAEVRATSAGGASTEPTLAELRDREDRALLATWGLSEELLSDPSWEDSMAGARRPRPPVTTAPLPLCPAIDLRGDGGAELVGAAAHLRAIFSANVAGERLDALLEDAGAPDEVLSIARETATCPAWFDGERLGFDEPRLGVLPIRILFGGSGRTYVWGMDDALEARSAIAELRVWLAAHPGSRPTTADGTGVLLHVVTRTDDALVCVVPEANADVPVVARGRCFAVNPAPGRVAIDAEGSWDESGERFAGERVHVELDGRTYELAAEGLVRAHRRRFWRQRETGVPRHAVRLAIVEVTPEPLPWTALAILHPRPIGDGCVGGDAPLCCLVDDRWACIDAVDEPAAGHVLVDTIVAGSASLRFEAEHATGGFDDRRANTILHLFAVEGERLVEYGSTEVRSSDELSDHDEQGVLVEWRRRETAWSYQLVGDRCVTYLEATETGAHVDASTRGREVLDVYPIDEWAPVDDVLPRLAPRADSESMSWAGRDSDLRVQVEGPPRHWAVADRRGSWRLEDDGWHRVASCD